MNEQLRALGESRRWRLMVSAGKRAAEEQGYKLVRRPGRGLSNIWDLTDREGRKSSVCIRTTMDRWYAFPPLDGGKRWKTLDDVERVLVVSVDDVDTAKAIEVYEFPAEEVRKRFDESYSARMEAGHTVRDNFGMWVALDKWDESGASRVGSGIIEQYPAIARYPLADLLREVEAEAPATEDIEDAVAVADDQVEAVREPHADRPSPQTIADVIRYARERIAQIAGVSPDAVKLDLKLEI
jgi:hypothetical protein